ncbi:MAG TPA: RNA 2',3'-cyclic phosphodiesterase [Vicinamibacteria bacterium]|nr:RNA 2',3'-cyclic phosphodiesterase [Vicinamibacteria bacterium]
MRRGGDPPDHVRAFVALAIGSGLRARIAELMGEIRHRVPGVRFVRPEGIHLTLRFLGSTLPAQIQQLGPRLQGLAAACPPSEAQISGLGLFPPRGSPRVLWLGVSLAPPVLALQAACEEAAVGVGFPRETRPFRSHLTLGRWRERAPSPELPPADLGKVSLESLVLYRSEVGREGALYTPLASFLLGA